MDDDVWRPEPPRDLPEDTEASFNPDRSRLGPAGGFIESPTRPVAPDNMPRAPGFEFQARLGEGGFGEVWQALQVSLGRVVAVKRLKERPGDGSTAHAPEALRAAFRQEALTTAALDHPNIVPVYQLGRGEEGEDLLALKLVRGDPWHRLLRDDFRSMPSGEYLAKHIAILASVAQAVAFAHSRGIVHRDIKPSQVMIGEFGEVLLMDWGLALAYDPTIGIVDAGQGGRFRLATCADASNPAGTVAYMAPEQTHPTAARIGPWTDVYLLGATLYFVLTGNPPHAGSGPVQVFYQAHCGNVRPMEDAAPGREIPPDLARLALEAMQRDPDARVGSAREFVSRLNDFLTGATRRREAERLLAEARSVFESPRPGAVRDLYERHGRVDRILAQALQLVPSLAGARELRAINLSAQAEAEIAQGDLILARVHVEDLEHESGAAEGVVPRLRGLLSDALARRERERRQRVLLGVAAAALLVVALGAALFARSQRQAREIAVLRAEKEEARAVEQERLRGLFERANKLRVREVELAAELARVAPMPESLTPNERELHAISRAMESGALARLVDRRGALRRERMELDGQGVPLGLEPFELSLAEANVAVGMAQSRGDSLAAYALYENAARADGQAPEPVLGLGIAAARAGFPTSATMHLDRAAELMRSARGDSHPDYARTLALAGAAYRSLDPSAEAYRTYFRRSLDVLEPQWRQTSLALAQAHLQLGDARRAADFSSDTLAVAIDRYGGDSMEQLGARAVLASALVDLGDGEGAEAQIGRSLELRAKYFGSDRPEFAVALDMMASLELRMARTREALGNLQRAEGILAADPGTSRSVQMAGVLMSKADALRELGRGGEALEAIDESIAIRREKLGPDHPDLANALSAKAAILHILGRHAEIEPLLRESMAITERSVGADHPRLAWILNDLAVLLKVRGDAAQAEGMYRRALAILAKARGEEHTETATAKGNLGQVLAALGRLDEAERHLRESLETHERVDGADHPLVGRAAATLAEVLAMRGEREEAEELMRRGIVILGGRLGEAHADTIMLKLSLADALRRRGALDEAEGIYRDAAVAAEAALGTGHPRVARAYGAWGALLRDRRRHAEAAPVLARALELAVASSGAESDAAAYVMMDLARNELAMEHFDGAVAWYGRCAAILRSLMESPRGRLKYGSELSTVEFALGDIALRRGDAPAAAGHAKAALKLAAPAASLPGGGGAARMATLRMLLGRVYEAQGKMDEARAEWEGARASLPAPGPSAPPPVIAAHAEALLLLDRVGEGVELMDRLRVLKFEAPRLFELERRKVEESGLR